MMKGIYIVVSPAANPSLYKGEDGISSAEDSALELL